MSAESGTVLPAEPGDFEAALAAHHIDLPAEQVATLRRYCQALWAWNEKLNLTRHTTYEKFVARDLIDSLALEPFLASGEHVLDVGTGGGVPGVVLAIIRPDLSISLCDSVAKKAKVVQSIVAETGLEVPVHHARAEQLLETQHFDSLVARAVAPLAKLLTWLEPHWDAFNQLLIIKGPAWIEERRLARQQNLLAGLQLRKLASYPMIGTDSQSVVLQIRSREE